MAYNHRRGDLIMKKQGFPRWVWLIVLLIVLLIASLLWMVSCAAPAPTAEPTPISDDTIIRGPYLQSVTPDSIIIVWELSLIHI